MLDMTGEWAGLKRIYQTCTAIQSSSPPLIVEAVKMICREKQMTRITSSKQQGSLAEMHLKVSQTTAAENGDRDAKDPRQKLNNQRVTPTWKFWTMPKMHAHFSQF